MICYSKTDLSPILPIISFDSHGICINKLLSSFFAGKQNDDFVIIDKKSFGQLPALSAAAARKKELNALINARL